MIDIKDFSQLQKKSSRSFNDQKALIKKIIAGREIKCPDCGQNIQHFPPETSEQPGIRCTRRCTDIELDFS